ncbi:CRISPR-associated endonuclease Cas2, partial [Limosilactobacillus reuteri]
KKSAQFIEKRISTFLPETGTIQSMIMTEKQYNDMHFLLGESSKDVRNLSGRTIIL